MTSPDYGGAVDGIAKSLGATVGFHYAMKDQMTNLQNLSNQSIYQMQGLNSQNASVMGQQSMSYLSSGVLINAGTAGKVLEQSAARATQDIATVGANYRSQSKAIASQRKSLFFNTALDIFSGNAKAGISLAGM
jgi:hypothetical protein